MLVHKRNNDQGIVFAVQSTGRKMDSADDTLRGLENQTVYEFGCRDFERNIIGAEDIPTDVMVIPFGGTKIIDMYVKKEVPSNWFMFYEPREFSQDRHVHLLGSEMLNGSGTFYELGKILDWTWEDHMFMKPHDDLKMFSGLVVSEGRTLREELAQMMHQELIMDMPILVAKTKKILAEYRIVMAFGEVIGISQYQENGRTISKPVSTKYALMLTKYAEQKDRWFRPAEVYVIDVAEIDEDMYWGNSFKVVEYNCFHASGLYSMNRSYVYDKIHQGLVKQKQREQNRNS